MTADITPIQLPLSPEQALQLAPGDLVTLNGLVFTGRSRLHIRAIEEGIVPPIDFNRINAFFHVGPVMRKNGDAWEIRSIEPTSSIRFERYAPELIRRLQLRVLIGKTTMGPRTAAALKEVRGVHLSKIGLCGNRLKRQVKKVLGVHFLEELGKTEATWVFEVEQFGPFFVDIDAHGRNYFAELAGEVERARAEVERELGIPENYRYTDVNPS